MLDKNKDISINTGTGVHRVDINITPNVDEPEDIKNTPEIINLPEFNDRFLYNNVGQKTYYNKAFFKGQSRQPGMYKLGYPKSKLFTLSTQEDLEQYNSFLAQIGGEGDDPQITNLTIDKQFYEGKFVILVSYNEVWYILPDQK